MNYLRVDLKVCEGCGVLWLRTEVDGVYCRGCARRLSEFPAPRKRHAGGRKRRLARASGCAAAANTTGGAR
jgi:hypothetical protein